MKSMTNSVDEGITSMIVILRGRGRLTLYSYILLKDDDTGHLNLSNFFGEALLNSPHGCLTPAGKVTNLLAFLFSLKMAQRSEAKSAKRGFASKYFEF